MKPSDYRHIAAFCRTLGLSNYQITKKQIEAAAADAPIDACYKIAAIGGWAWVPFSDCGKRTQMAIEVELNRGKSNA